MNPPLEKTLAYMIYGALMVQALGLLTSTTLLAFSHILMIGPMIYFLPRTDYKVFPKSAWALLALIAVIILSVVFNQDIAAKGFTPILKSKYFLFSFLSLSPLSWYFKNHMTEKKVSLLLYVFCLAATLASISGMIAMKTEFNYISWHEVSPFRNAGLFGMGMNYAHNLTYFLIIVLGLILFREKLKNIINAKFLYAVFIINFVGLYFSYTRGAFLALLVGAPFYFFKKHKTRFISVLLGLSILGLALYFGAGKSVIRASSDSERMSQWHAASKAFQERPILGYGYLNFEPHSLDIKKRYNLAEPHYGGHAHGNPFEMLATTGLVGFFAFALWLIFWLMEMYKRNDIVANLGLAFAIVFIVGGLTQSTISLGINLFFIMGGYAVTQGNLRSKNIFC